MADTHLQITNIGWKMSKSKDTLIPVIKLYNSAEKALQTITLGDYTFNYKLSEEKFCVGYTTDSEYVPCKFNNRVEKSTESQCFYCIEQEGFRSAFLFNKPPNENAKKYLDKEHYVYLAYFHPGTIKVGTASAKRKDLRLIEQDALVSLYIAKVPNADVVKKLENYISKHFNITQFINSSKKLKNLDVRIQSTKACKLLKDKSKAIKSDLKKNLDFSEYIIEEKCLDFTEYSYVYYPKDQINIVRKHDIPYLVGRFLGLRGRYLLFENDNHIMVSDIKKVIGRKIVDYEDVYKYKLDDKLTLF